MAKRAARPMTGPTHWHAPRWASAGRVRRWGTAGRVRRSATASGTPPWAALWPASLGSRPRLVLASALMLFVELALIRWTSSNNLYLVHLTNFVLLASFLGIGLGFLLAGARRDLFPLAPPLLALLVGFVLVFPVRTGTSSAGGWELTGALGMPPVPRPLSLAVIFLLTVAVLMGLAQEVARTFAGFAPLEAYRLDILGSLTGIGVFTAGSFLRLPPVGWGIAAALAFALLLGSRVRGWPVAGITALVLMLGAESVIGPFQWSPYYKIHTQDLANGSVRVDVNNTPLQTTFSVDQIRRDSPFYLYPYTYTASRAEVLVIGAGTGNDVAVALAEGATRIDAVEIDPVLLQIGRDRHPNRPYSDPRVTTYVDDGRAFMQRTDRHYDLILLALPDSATIVTGQSALRLENYLFTTEALERARSLLKPGGTFAMYNYYEPWLLDRYANTVRTVYDTAPCVQLGPTHGQRQQAVLTLRKDASTGGCTRTWAPAGTALEPSVDDRPFPYLGTRTIPAFYLWMLGLVLLASLVLVRGVAGPLRGMRPYADLFFMGGAFLLLETKNVVQFALLFGTTWVVNAAVFAGVLLSVLAAIETARRIRIRRPLMLYVGVLAALTAAWLIPQEALLDLAPVPRFLAGVTVAFLPIFLANLLFAVRFKGVGSTTVAFGANLLGAMVGGALEYLALVFGYHALLVMVAVLYGLALLAGRRHLVAAAAT